MNDGPPAERDRRHPDMPESVEEPSSRPDPNLEEQTMAGEEPGPGASKMENLRRAAEQVRAQKERTDDADPKGSVPDREA